MDFFSWMEVDPKMSADLGNNEQNNKLLPFQRCEGSNLAQMLLC